MKAIIAGAILISALGTAVAHADQPPWWAQTKDGPQLNLAHGGGGGAGGGAPQSLINANQAELQPPGWHEYQGGPFEGLLNWLNGTGANHGYSRQNAGDAAQRP